MEWPFTDYRRSLDSRTGLGTVNYSIAGGQYTREYFCSFPSDVLAARYAAKDAKLNLTIQTTTKHDKNQVNAVEGRITLVGEAPLVQDNVEFMQVIHIEAIDGQEAPHSNGSVKVTGATDVRIYLGGYTQIINSGGSWVVITLHGHSYLSIANFLRSSSMTPSA